MEDLQQLAGVGSKKEFEDSLLRLAACEYEKILKDAARYRWLRDSIEAEITLRVAYGDKRELSHEYLDAAIDKAMEQK